VVCSCDPYTIALLCMLLVMVRDVKRNLSLKCRLCKDELWKSSANGRTVMSTSRM